MKITRMQAVNALKTDGIDVSPLPSDLLRLKPLPKQSPMPLYSMGYLAALKRSTPEDVQLADSLGLAVSDPCAPGGKREQNTLEIMLGPGVRADRFNIWWNLLKAICFPMFNHRHKLFTLCICQI